MRLRRPSIRSGRNVGFDVRGCGSVAASSAACSALRREAGTPKYARLAASIPQMPGPHSATFRYSSRIRSLDKTSSSPSAVAASLSLRIGLREDERYRFFASCWVMVLAPRSADGGPESVGAVHAERVRDLGGVDPDVRTKPRILGDDHHTLEDGRDALKVDRADGGTGGR